jgi:3-methyladenine DNA glycosylase AlkC
MEPFKMMYSIKSSTELATALTRAWPDFPRRQFLADLESQLSPLELKDRMLLLSQRMSSCLPKDFTVSSRILVGALAQDDKDKVGVRGFIVWPMTQFIADHGLGHFEESMRALKEMTQRFTGEFSIRPFLVQHQDKALVLLEKWAKDPNEHVRRLVSEGTRPLLPWGQRLENFRRDPELTIHLLEALKTDSSEYVRKSVANHLNDHSKSHPDWLVKTLTRWKKENQDTEELRWILRHASRTLLKAGHPGSLRLHGYGAATDLKVKVLSCGPKLVKMNGHLDFQVEIRNQGTKKINVLADYAIHHRKANGTLAAKVFKGKKKTLTPKEIWIFEGRHRFRPITTRKYHAGEHQFEALINGSPSAKCKFTLKLDSKKRTKRS